MPRILVVTNLYPPHAKGGYELACGDVVRRWRTAGHDVIVLSGSGDDLPLTSVHGPVPSRWKRVAVERHAQAALRLALRRQPDVVSVWNMAGLPLALLSALAAVAVPVVYVVGDAWPTRSAANDPWLTPIARLPTPARRLLARLTGVPTALPSLGPTGRWVFCSASLRNDVVAAAPNHGPFADIAVVPLGIDLDDFPVADGADDRPWRGRLLFVGRLDPVKGIDTLLRALPLLPGTTLDVVGPPEGHHLERIARLVANLEIEARVSITSAPRDELAERYRSADACVFPSEWAEPFGLVPLEAMACGTPVVATGAGGSGDYLVDGENALLFRPGVDADLARAVRRLAGDGDLRRRLVAGGLETAPRYTTDRLARELEHHHLDVIGWHPSGR